MLSNREKEMPQVEKNLKATNELLKELDNLEGQVQDKFDGVSSDSPTDSSKRRVDGKRISEPKRRRIPTPDQYSGL